MTDSTPATAASDDLAVAQAQEAAIIDIRIAVGRAVELGFPAKHVRSIVNRKLFDLGAEDA